MLLLPQLVSRGTQRTLIMAQYLAIFAMRWGFLSGRTGNISFGHPLLIRIGAYTTAIRSCRFVVPVELSIPAAILTTVIGSIVFFMPAMRVRGSNFALVTLALMELMCQITQIIRPDLSGGTRGISGVETLTRGAV